MISGFKKKKIKSDQKSLGETLKGARFKKRASLHEAEEGTKVRAKYLKALEEGNWGVLPQAVYSRGFVLSYIKYLELDKEETLNLFQIESSIWYRSQETTNISYKNNLKESKVLITPKLLGYGALGVFFATMFGFIVFQLLNFAGAPSLSIVTPEDNIIVDQDNVDIKGLTDMDTVLSVNSEAVPVRDGGEFLLNLKLHRGINVIQVKAINKADKETAKVITIEYKPKTASNTDITTTEN